MSKSPYGKPVDRAYVRAIAGEPWVFVTAPARRALAISPSGEITTRSLSGVAVMPALEPTDAQFEKLVALGIKPPGVKRGAIEKALSETKERSKLDQAGLDGRDSVPSEEGVGPAALSQQPDSVRVAAQNAFDAAGQGDEVLGDALIALGLALAVDAA